MSKKLSLSNSQIDTYLTCQRKWWLDKVQKLRPSFKASPLYLGTNLDATIEAYLLKETDDWRAFYKKQVLQFEVNNNPKKLPEDILDMRFGAGDCDEKLIDQEKLDAYCDSQDIGHVDAKEFLLYCKGQRKKKKALEETEQKIFNYCAFLTLETKGSMLLEKLIEWIDENVAKVIAVQKKIEIENENGDKFIGYLDFIVELKDGRIVLIDLKTSSNPNLYYPEDAASKSRQLGIYSQEEGIPNVAYLIGDKNIRVRDPRVRLSYVEGIITEEHLDDVFFEIEEVTSEIKEKLPQGIGAFEKNLDSCSQFGGCSYKGYCQYKSKKGLEQV